MSTSGGVGCKVDKQLRIEQKIRALRAHQFASKAGNLVTCPRLGAESFFFSL